MGVDVSFQKCRTEHKVSDTFQQELFGIVQKHISDCGLGSKPQLHLNIGFNFIGNTINIDTFTCNFLFDPEKGAEQFCDPEK